MKRTSVPNSSPPVPPLAALAPPKTAGPSSTSQQSPEHIPVSSRELSTVMDDVCALSTTQASLDEWMHASSDYSYVKLVLATLVISKALYQYLHFSTLFPAPIFLCFFSYLELKN